MVSLERLAEWWRSRRPKRLRDQLAVTFDRESVTLRVLADLEPAWNRSFRWDDVERVCFTDAGLFQSDIVRVQLHSRKDVVVVPIEAAGGSEFFGAPCTRGLLPEPIWRRAMGDTSGGTHCWPPVDAPGASARDAAATPRAL